MEIKNAFSSFSINNLETALVFYSNTLGLNATKDTQMPGMLNIIIGEHKVIAYQKDNHEPATFTVLNLFVSNIESAVEELTSKGVKFEIYDDEYLKTDEKGISRGGPGPVIAWFKDPSGNFIAIIEE